MRKLFFYLFILEKIFLLLVYHMFEKKGKLFTRIRMNIENFLIFQPSRLRAKRIDRKLLKKFTPQRFMNNEGMRLYGWFIAPKGNNPTILHFHGQAESILSHQDFALMCVENGFGAFLLSYRGHYKSWGMASEAGVYADGQCAIEKLKKLGIPTDKIIIWGHSLGSAVAIETAINNKVKAAILQSPITDIKSAAIDICNFYLKRLNLPALGIFITPYIKKIDFIQKFNNIGKIAQINCPIFITHSKTDKIAPFKNALELHSQNPNSSLYVTDAGNHWDISWCKNESLEFINNLSNTNIVDKIEQ